MRQSLIALVAGVAALMPRAATAEPPAVAEVRQAVCRIVDDAALSNSLPPAFLTRILWHESRFQTDTTSRAGAEGIAQFMPKTAVERGLLDARQVRPAITEAARLLADLSVRLGNLGLAAAAFNAGTGRVTQWLHGQSALPVETSNYVQAVTGRPPDDWAKGLGPQPISGDGRPCVQVIVDLATPVSIRAANWSLQLDRVLSRAMALASGPRSPASNAAPASHQDAEVLCKTIRSLGARCAVYY